MMLCNILFILVNLAIDNANKIGRQFVVIYACLCKNGGRAKCSKK